MLNTIDRISRKIYNEIDLANRLNIHYGEETITDMTLLDLKLNSPNGLRTFQTSRQMESLQGTDWEWYIGSSRYGWVRIAVQAKKCDPKNHRYNSLNHYVGTIPGRRRQIDVLQSFSTQTNSLAFYTFYNHYANSRSNHWHCSTISFDRELLGWTITPIGNVRTSINTWGQRSFSAIHSYSQTIPVKCFFQVIRNYLIGGQQSLLNIDWLRQDQIIVRIDDLPEIFEGEPRVIDFEEFPTGLYPIEEDTIPSSITIFELND